MAETEESLTPLKSKIAFYMASMGTAFGLGNLWRFPYAVSDYGGGAFVFLYVLLAIFIGLPLVISEVILGKYIHKNNTTVSQLINELKLPQFAKKIFIALSWLSAAVSFAVFTYYCVLSGWSLHLMMRSLTSIVFDFPLRGELSFLKLKQNAWQQILLLSLHLILVYSIASRGLRKGVERWLSVIMPFFFGFLVFIALRLLSPTDLFNAAKYMIYPNFHKLTFESFSYVLGHVLFTMSLGFSIYLSFSSLLNLKAPSSNASSKIALIDTVVSLAIGCVIFPIIIVSGYAGRMSEALFRAFPNFIESENLPIYMALIFYSCVFIAAVNASLGLVEGMLFRIKKNVDYSRSNILSGIFIGVFISACIVVFLHRFLISTGGFIELLDDVVINLVLPFSALTLTLVTVFCVKRSFIESEFEIDLGSENILIYKTWRFIISYILPVMLILAIVLRFFG